ncbi:MAG: TIM barrel protein [Lachnospiraceae bacterium]
MQEKWENIANIGIVFPKLFGNITTEEQFNDCLMQILVDPFFTVVELSYIENKEWLIKAAKWTQKAGVEVIFNGGEAFRKLLIDLSSLDQETRKKSVEMSKMLVEQCYLLQAKIFHIVTGKYTNSDERIEMLQAFTQSVKEICEYAKEKSTDYELMISLETGDRYYDRKYLLGPTNEAIMVLRNVREEYDNFGLLLDQSHFPVMKEDPYKALWEGKEYLTHVHIGNSYVKDQSVSYFGDKHLPFGVKDSAVGTEELAKFLRTLDEIGFYQSPKATKKPTISFEVGPMDEETPEFVLANIKRVFYEAWLKQNIN